MYTCALLCFIGHICSTRVWNKQAQVLCCLLVFAFYDQFFPLSLEHSRLLGCSFCREGAGYSEVNCRFTFEQAPFCVLSKRDKFFSWVVSLLSTLLFFSCTPCCIFCVPRSLNAAEIYPFQIDFHLRRKKIYWWRKTSFYKKDTRMDVIWLLRRRWNDGGKTLFYDDAYDFKCYVFLPLNKWKYERIHWTKRWNVIHLVGSRRWNVNRNQQ